MTSVEGESKDWDDILYKILNNSVSPYLPLRYVSEIISVSPVELTFNSVSNRFFTKYSEKLITFATDRTIFIGLSSRIAKSVIN